MIRRPPKSTRTDTLFPDTTLFRSPGLTAGPSLRDALETVAQKLDRARPLGPASFVAYAEGLTEAYEKRLAGMGDTENQGGCTTNLCVIDPDGNLVALTQTLLSLFGRRSAESQVGKECVSKSRARR